MKHTTAKPVRVSGWKARAYVQNGINFTNHNGQLYGRWESPSLYVVYSYGAHWPLFVYDTTLATWYENEDRASRTTSKHRTQTHPLVNTETRSCGWLRGYLLSANRQAA
jgi:hypothetical protein